MAPEGVIEDDLGCTCTQSPHSSSEIITMTALWLAPTKANCYHLPLPEHTDKGKTSSP